MKKPKFSPQFKPELIDLIFSCSTLYEMNSFFYIEKDFQTYDTLALKDKSIVEKSKFINKKFQDNFTIIVKNLENFSPLLREECLRRGEFVNLHMYLNKSKDSKSFDFHCDDSDVEIHILFGSKTIQLLEAGLTKDYTLEAGESLFIKKGTQHRAINHSLCCSFSFGIKDKSYFVPGGLTFADFQGLKFES